MATYNSLVATPDNIAWCDCAGRLTDDHQAGYYLNEDYEVTPVTLQMKYDLGLVTQSQYDRLKAIQGVGNYPRPAILRKEGTI